MTLPSWPVSLPAPNRPGYQAQYQDPRLKRTGDQGPSGYRRRFSSVPKLVSLAVILNRSQKSEFDEFFINLTAYGSLPFWMPDPVTNGWPLLGHDFEPLLDGAGVPILMAAQWLCLFGGTMPVETIKGIEFQISFQVEVMP